MVKPKKARSFKISKLKNPSEVTRICDLLKCPAPRHHSFKLDSKLKSTQVSCPCQNISNWGTPNLLQLMLNKSQMD